jgi:hypothetical protein
LVELTNHHRGGPARWTVSLPIVWFPIGRFACEITVVTGAPTVEGGYLLLLRVAWLGVPQREPLLALLIHRGHVEVLLHDEIGL